MTALLNPPPLATPRLPPPAMRPYRFTNDDFRWLTEHGFFTDQFVMLIDGEFIHVPHPGPPHNMAVGLADYMLKSTFPLPGYWVRIQCGLETALDTNPAPDLAVVEGSPRVHTTNPRRAVLVVEVSDTSFAYDSGEKSNLYAAAGVPEYWVIDVNDPRLLVFRDPVADATAPRGYRYATTLTLTPADAISPLAVPSATIRVADMLP